MLYLIVAALVSLATLLTKPTKAVGTLGYRPNLAARNLAIGGSGVVLYGVVLYIVPRNIVPRNALGELPMEVASRLTTALARHGIVLSLQFETDDDRNVVDAINDLNPMAVTRRSSPPMRRASRRYMSAARSCVRSVICTCPSVNCGSPI